MSNTQVLESVPHQKRSKREQRDAVGKWWNLGYETLRGWAKTYGDAVVHAIRPEGGDMDMRGIWQFVKTKSGLTCSFAPFSQLSCAIGLANIYSPDGLDVVLEKTKELGHTFIFTVVYPSLVQAVLNRPENFKVLFKQDSWMGWPNGNAVYICASICND